MNFTQLIINEILKELDEQNGVANIARNELALEIGCVPSQVSYVITSRFTPEHGYIVESKRGGGGYIQIRQVHLDEKDITAHILSIIGDSIDTNKSKAIINQLYNSSYIEKGVFDIMNTIVSENTLKNVPQKSRDTVRADLLKCMILSLHF